MISKFQLISGLAEATTQEIASSEKEWKSFLHTAGWMSKYPFSDQVLIYAQRPNATACASMEFWNEKMLCWVNKGAKGIALIDRDAGAGHRLKYVFDVSDVHESWYGGQKPVLWRMKEEHKDYVIKKLEETYGPTDDKETFESRLLGITTRIAEDVVADITEELSFGENGINYGSIHDDAIIGTLSSSIAFMTLSRCLPNWEEVADGFDFSHIGEFDSVESVSILGNYTADLAKPLITEVIRASRAAEKEISKNILQEVENDFSRNYNADRSENIVGNTASAYVADKANEDPAIEENSATSTSIPEREKGADYGDRVHSGRGLSDSEPRGGEGAGGRPLQMGSNADELPEGEQEGSLHGAFASRETKGALPRYPESGRGEDGDSDERDGESGEGGRDLETSGSDALGTEDEQYPEQGGGDRTLRADIQPVEQFEQMTLFHLFPSFEEQMGNIVAAEAKERMKASAAISLSDEELLDIVRAGGGRENSRKRIYAKYLAGKNPSEMTEFIRDEIGTTGKGFIFSGQKVSVWYDEKGLSIGKGNSAKMEGATTYSWSLVEEFTRKMVEDGTYMSSSEAFLVDTTERQRIARQVYFFFRDGMGETPESIGVAGNNYPDSEERLMEFLSTHDGRNLVAQEIQNAAYKLEHEEATLRWQYIKSPEYLLSEIADLDTDRREFPLSDTVNVKVEDFITQDEIDARLTRGSGVSQGLFRIYDYFMEGHDKKDNAAFLKNEYGTGGQSDALIGNDKSWEDHDAKGIKLTKGNLLNPNTSILLNWNAVEQRIRELIAEDKYLSPKAKEAYKEYKKKQQQEALQKEQERLVEVIEEKEDESSYTIYQISDDADDRRDIMFEGLDRLSDMGLSVDSDNYDAVYTGRWEDTTSLDSLFEQFNINYPDDYKGRSMSVSDVIVVHQNGEDRAYFCDSFGFREVPEFLDRNLAQQQALEIYDEEINDGDLIDDGFLIPDEAWTEARDEDLPEEWREGNADDLIASANENYISSEKAENYRIIDDDLGKGGAKEKFWNNIKAISTLKQIEEEKRSATLEEQHILSRYVGWGGLADAFDDMKENWASEYQELKDVLTPEEYASARESTLNAHYTSPEIIEGIYEGLRQMGFSSGNVLEPSMGIGNFFGKLPEDMDSSRLYGVELDSLTGRIAKQLYPNANIQAKGFEETDFPNDFFDVAIGNVPFGNYKVSDKPYDKLNFQVHDYFFAKSLDKVRPGGVVAFVTSKGTLDKKNSAARKYLAQRAELLGAIRLPNTAFKENAGTEVTSDIIFLKKRDRIADLEPDWVRSGINADGIEMNQYFINHPEQVLGRMEMVSGPFGMESTCVPNTDLPLKEQLKQAIRNIEGQIEEAEMESLDDELVGATIPADPDVRNFSYTVVDGEVYYRENSIMKPVDVSDTAKERIKGMVHIRNITRELIDLQLNEYPESAIKEKQQELGRVYDDFTKKYGIINSQGNRRAFSQDSAYCLLCSLENIDDDGNFAGKADMFYKRTIKKAVPVTSVDTPSEALAVSLSEKARVDLGFMAELSGKSEHEITEDLRGVIYQNPLTGQWETADEYLSGNVREKLKTAQTFAENHPEYAINVQGLMQVQPKELDASEIEVRIGATWIEPHFIEDFMRDTFETPEYLFDRNVMGVQFSSVTGEWNVKGKNADYGNTMVNMTYGTSRANAYKILEDSLNLKDTRVYDTIVEDGKEKRVLNKKETTIASQKQEAIREAFKDWVFNDPDRRQYLVEKYNVLFNSIRPREYDGSHLTFPGMSPDITLKEHQKNAVAHVLYGDNTLLAHCVGAGKTFEMAASAMEMKRLGLCQKSLFVVPNHLTEQWASDFLRLYPGANILAATKRDFEPANRKKFCSRIATGDYDAIIIGHSQFEKIPLSKERQIAVIERQIDEIEEAIKEMKAAHGERYTIKQMEKSRKQLSVRLEKLNDQTRKDNVVTFEELGVDRLFVDESQVYKNLFLYTKMRNVAGIAQSESQRSSDMFAKCQYLDELTGGKGVTFATGTPISNSMTELYTNMRYLQYSTLQKMGLGQFDAWAASFGESQTAIELSPEGSGYRAKTRFARFFNLPELISLFKEAADIQTEDMLKLPVPEAEYENVVLKPSQFQKDMVASLAERAERVRNRMVDSSVDNMLKITNDGRKLALDQRLMNEMLPPDDNSKAEACAERAFKIWQETAKKKCAQLIFCDQSTPKNDGRFNVYDDIKQRLMEKGVPPDEIAFIHDANTETRKAELFAKVRSGQVRFLLGSTQKMGAGTNVQDRLIALHHLDCPWRPSDLSQQEGRILRQGNTCPKVKIFRYVTENTFDSYSWQLIENKQRFIGQIMTSKSPVRSAEDIDEAALSYAEVKALATGNPYIKEKMDLDIQVSKLKLMKANHTSQKYRLEDNITQNYPRQISALTAKVAGYERDIQMYERNKPADKDVFSMTVGNKTYDDRKEAGAAIIVMCKEIHGINNTVEIGNYLGFQMNATFDTFNNRFLLNVKGGIGHEIEVGTDPSGNITRINNVLEGMEKQREEAAQKLSNVEHQLEMAKIEVEKPFEKEQELSDKMSRLSELNALLNMDEKGDDALTLDEEAVPEQPQENRTSEQPQADQVSEQKNDECEICGAATSHDGDDTQEKSDTEDTEDKEHRENNPVIPIIDGKPSVLAKIKFMNEVAAGNVAYHGMEKVREFRREAL